MKEVLKVQSILKMKSVLNYGKNCHRLKKMQGLKITKQSKKKKRNY